MKSIAPDRLSSARGQALLELALAMPVLFLLLAMIVDACGAIRANNIITAMSREGANLAARGWLPGTQATVDQNIMDTIACTAQRMRMDSNGMIIITVVQGSGAASRILSQTKWERGRLAATSRLGTPATDGRSPPPVELGFTLPAGEIVKVVEVFYTYPSIFQGAFPNGPPQLYAKTLF